MYVIVCACYIPTEMLCSCHVANAKFMEGLMYTVSAVSNIDFEPVIVQAGSYGAPVSFPVGHAAHPFKILATNDLGFRSDWQELARSDDDDWCCCWQLRAIKQIWWSNESTKSATGTTDSHTSAAISATSAMSALTVHVDPSALLEDLQRLPHLGAVTRGTQSDPEGVVRQMLETMTHHTLCQVHSSFSHSTF